MENIQPESNHPVLTNLKEQIAKLQADYELLDSRYGREIRARQDRETYTKEAFISALLGGYDRETITYLAYELDIDLTELKTYTVKVEFQVEAMVDFGEELDQDSLDFSLSGDNIQDYSFDVLSINEN